MHVELVERAVRRSASVADLVEASAGLPELQIQLVGEGASPTRLGAEMAAATDAITQRLIELGEARLGGPPVPWAWIACGSQARREQTVSADQDNALLLSDAYAPERHDERFASLARLVNEGLAACGFALCAGEVLASTPRWRQPLGGWKLHFDGWIARPSPKALMHAAIFFDVRTVAGDPSLLTELQAHVRERVRESQLFVAFLAATALRRRPPLGLFHRFVVARRGDRAGTLDLKKAGIMPIVDLARLHALAVGSGSLGTLDRLRDAADRRALSPAGARELADAFDLTSTLRARHQVEQLKDGCPADNDVRPDELSRLERGRLKAAFRVIRRHQTVLAELYQVGRLA
jgi:CBS domain-containing protein